MALSFGHFLSSLLLLAFLVDQCRAEISKEDSIKITSTKYHEDDLVQVMLHSLYRRFSLERQNLKLHREPTYDGEDNNDSQFSARLALASQVKGEYYGVQATMDVYNLPEVGQNQISSAIMSLMNTDIRGEDNIIVIGWHVAPELYGDHYTHFFMIWQGRQQACLNLQCQDFVLDKSSEIIPGSAIQQSFGRGQNITLKISKNESSGDWWLYYGDKAVGHMPRSVLGSLQESANVIAWGGHVFYEQSERSPPMGSGHLPSEGKEKAVASMSNINIALRNGETVAPTYDSVTDDPNCYEISTGDVILYGGPGGCKE